MTGKKKRKGGEKGRGKDSVQRENRVGWKKHCVLLWTRRNQRQGWFQTSSIRGGRQREEATFHRKVNTDSLSVRNPSSRRGCLLSQEGGKGQENKMRERKKKASRGDGDG